MAARTKNLTTSTAPNEETQLVPGAVANDVIAEVYETIRMMARDATLALNIEIGRVIVTKFYGGELAAWRDRGQKDASFRKLAVMFDEDADAPEGTSAAGLYRAVSIFVMDKQWGVSGRKHLTMTHVRALIGLPEAHQERLLSEAADKEWSGERVEREAAKVRKKEGDGRGRPPLPGFVKGATRMRRMLDAEDDVFGELAKADDMKDEDVREVLETITSMEAKLQDVRTSLEVRLNRKP